MSRKFHTTLSVTSVALILVLLSCGGTKVILETNARDQYEASLAAYQAGDYQAAEGGFKRVIFSFPSSVYVDDAQFYLARTYVGLKEYDAAVVEYQFLIDNFPGSTYREDSELGIGETYFKMSPNPLLDQSNTKKAIYHLRRFLAQHPDSPKTTMVREMLDQAKDKLAQRLFNSSQTYRNLGAFTSERLYLEVLLLEYPESSIEWEAKLRLSEILLDMGETETALAYLQEILESDTPSTSLKERARGLLASSPES